MIANHRTRILHIFGRMNRGGAEMRALDIMRHVDRQQFDLQFCALSGLPGELDDEVRQLGGQVHLLSLGPRLPWHLRRLLRQQHFDVVHSHVHASSGLPLLVAAGEGVAVRVAHFESSSDGRRSTWRRRLQRQVMHRCIDRYATHIVAVSRAVCRAVTANALSTRWGRQWARDPRCQVLYYGVDRKSFPTRSPRTSVQQEFQLPDSSRIYVHVGNLRRPKNHKRLLSIFACLARQDDDAFLLLVGRGDAPEVAQLQQQAVALGIEQRLRFAGQREDVPRLLSAADLMIFPSLWEGLPGAVLEACAAGTPVLASDIPVMDEIGEHLPLLRCLSLTCHDGQWAAAAESLRRQGATAGRREAAKRDFGTSPFSLEACVQAHCRIWNSHALPAAGLARAA